jgi:hypothetical protein
MIEVFQLNLLSQISSTFGEPKAALGARERTLALLFIVFQARHADKAKRFLTCLTPPDLLFM